MTNALSLSLSLSLSLQWYIDPNCSSLLTSSLSSLITNKAAKTTEGTKMAPPLPPPPPPRRKKKGTVPRSALSVQLSFYALASLFAIPYGALNSVNQTSQAVFGGAPGASSAAVSLADSLSRTANVALSAAWVCFLFFVPALLEFTRGARNAFAVMMFAWTGVRVGF